MMPDFELLAYRQCAEDKLEGVRELRALANGILVEVELALGAGEQITVPIYKRIVDEHLAKLLRDGRTMAER